MTSKQKLIILDVTRLEGISSKTGRPYDMRTAQCVLYQSTSEGDQAVVGRVMLPDGLKETTKGEYLAEFAFSQSMDGHLVPRIVALHPCAIGARPVNPGKSTT